VRASKIGADLLELVVTGVVHIAAANPQNAVRLNIYRAFDADVEIRTIFIVIMDRALRKGFKPPAAQVQELGVRKQKLCEVMLYLSAFPDLGVLTRLYIARQES
jgi:hypothetical protein